MKLSLSTITAALLTLGTIAAQGGLSVVGLTEGSSLAARIDPFSCNAGLCPTSLPPSAAPWAGGTAHDGNDGYTWFSNGFAIEKTDVRSGCTPVCGPFPDPFASPGAEITGLAYNEQMRQLFVSYADNRIATFDHLGGCALNPVSICNAPVPSNHIITGLATDDLGGEIIYASSPFLGPAPINLAFIHRAQIGSPCTPFCVFELGDCAGTGIQFGTGLGFDACRRTLYMTDGEELYSIFLDQTFCGNIQLFNCCTTIPNTAGERLTGLCVLPAPVVSTGPICFNGASPVCSTMTHSLNGDPILGNLGFAINLNDAPSGSNVFCFLDLGGTVPPFFSPPLCSGILVTNFFASTVAVGAPGCNGFATVPFPLPTALPFLCGVTLSSQWVGLTSSSIADHFVTDALTFTIASS